MALRSNVNITKTIVQLYPPQNIERPNYQYLIEMKNNYYLNESTSVDFSHINTDIKYHLDNGPLNVFKKDKYFWSYYSPQKNSNFVLSLFF
jgi:hypothetical protein